MHKQRMMAAEGIDPGTASQSQLEEGQEEGKQEASVEEEVAK